MREKKQTTEDRGSHTLAKDHYTESRGVAQQTMPPLHHFLCIFLKGMVHNMLNVAL